MQNWKRNTKLRRDLQITGSNIMPKRPQNRYVLIPLSGAFAYVSNALSYLQTYMGMVAIGAIPIVYIILDSTQSYQSTNITGSNQR